MSVAKKLIPLLDRVLVEKVAARTKTVGGIILPETASSKARKRKVNEGRVIAVGPGRRDKDGALLPVGVAKGDRVLLPEYGGQTVKLNDTEFMLFRDEEILGVLKDE